MVSSDIKNAPPCRRRGIWGNFNASMDTLLVGLENTMSGFAQHVTFLDFKNAISEALICPQKSLGRGPEEAMSSLGEDLLEVAVMEGEPGQGRPMCSRTSTGSAGAKSPMGDQMAQ